MKLKFENAVFKVEIYGENEQECSAKLSELLSGKFFHYAGELSWDTREQKQAEHDRFIERHCLKLYQKAADKWFNERERPTTGEVDYISCSCGYLITISGLNDAELDTVKRVHFEHFLDATKSPVGLLKG